MSDGLYEPDYAAQDAATDAGKAAAMYAHECSTLRARLRTTAQTLIAEVGATGPMDAEQAATRAVERIITLRAENARLREALEKYGKHLEHCDVDDLFIPKPCNCGLTAALQETRHE